MQEITECKHASVPEGVTLSGVACAIKLLADSAPEKSDFGCRRCKARRISCTGQSLRQKDGGSGKYRTSCRYGSERDGFGENAVCPSKQRELCRAFCIGFGVERSHVWLFFICIVYIFREGLPYVGFRNQYHYQGK